MRYLIGWNAVNVLREGGQPYLLDALASMPKEGHTMNITWDANDYEQGFSFVHEYGSAVRPSFAA